MSYVMRNGRRIETVVLADEPDQVKVRPATREARRSAPSQPTRGPKFFKMPIVWAERLNAAKGAATLKVANHLLLKEFETHQQTIRLANVALATIEISRKQKWRALAELERLGLIRIDRRNGKSPMVALLHLG